MDWNLIVYRIIFPLIVFLLAWLIQKLARKIFWKRFGRNPQKERVRHPSDEEKLAIPIASPAKHPRDWLSILTAIGLALFRYLPFVALLLYFVIPWQKAVKPVHIELRTEISESPEEMLKWYSSIADESVIFDLKAHNTFLNKYGNRRICYAGRIHRIEKRSTSAYFDVGLLECNVSLTDIAGLEVGQEVIVSGIVCGITRGQPRRIDLDPCRISNRGPYDQPDALEPFYFLCMLRFLRIF